MGLMDFLKPADINAGVEEFRATPGARLVDVRTPGEYAGGHIPGAVNVPLQQIGAIASEVPDKGTPLFVYCMSGARSQQAVGALPVDVGLIIFDEFLLVIHSRLLFIFYGYDTTSRPPAQ